MFHIIVNPISGRKKNQDKKNKFLLQIKKYLDEKKIAYKWYVSEYYRHPNELAKKITSENENGSIVTIGGDGTFNEVLNGVNNLDKWNLGLIPAGSGNDFASAINFSKKKPLECLDKIFMSEAKKTDYILVNGKRCANVLGTGIDIAVLENFEKHKKLKGKFRYLVALISALLHFDWYSFDVSIDGKEFEHKSGFIICLCNGSSIGGGITICPGANCYDEKLEFVYVDKMKKIKIPFYLVSLLNKKIFKKKGVQHIYCQKAVFKSNKPFVIQIDGNITEPNNEYNCEIVKGGLNLYR